MITSAPPRPMDLLDAARAVLFVASVSARRWDDRPVEPNIGLDEESTANAIHLLADGGAIEEVCHADWHGNRTWCIRTITTAGLEVARLIRDDMMWERLKFDLSALGNPLARLVQGYRDNFDVIGTAIAGSEEGTSRAA